jgi:hypothetical protein
MCPKEQGRLRGHPGQANCLTFCPLRTSHTTRRRRGFCFQRMQYYFCAWTTTAVSKLLVCNVGRRAQTSPEWSIQVGASAATRAEWRQVHSEGTGMQARMRAGPADPGSGST